MSTEGTYTKTNELLIAMAHADEYPQLDVEIGGQARVALSLLCSFVLADADIAVGAQRDAAFRAIQMGVSCHHALTYFLADKTNMAEAMAYFPQLYGVLPLNPEQYREATLDFIANDNIFRWFSTFTPWEQGAR